MYSVCAWPSSYDHRPSRPHYAGTEHVGFSPTRQTLLAPSAKRREVFGMSGVADSHPHITCVGWNLDAAQEMHIKVQYISIP